MGAILVASNLACAMRIARVRIANFRNFRSLDVALGQHAVIVGENKVGKSNFLFALRLLLDPSLPDSARQLRLEDFWEGLDRPIPQDVAISVSVDLTDFETDENLVAVLGEHLIVPRPMVARLTYELRARPGLDGSPQKDSDYEYILFGRLPGELARGPQAGFSRHLIRQRAEPP